MRKVFTKPIKDADFEYLYELYKILHRQVFDNPHAFETCKTTLDNYKKSVILRNRDVNNENFKSQFD